MEEDIRKEQKKMREDFLELQQQVADNTQDIAVNKQNIDDHTQEIHNINARHIPIHIRSKLIIIFSV